MIIIYISEKRKLSCSISLLLLLWVGEGTHNTFGLNLGCKKGKSSLNPDSHTITDWASSWRLWSTKMVFHDINQGERFVYSHLMHALMSTCDPMLFKFSSIGIRANMDDIWAAYLGYFRFPLFWFWKPFFLELLFLFLFFFVWCCFSVFKPDWCWRLVKNIV